MDTIAREGFAHRTPWRLPLGLILVLLVLLTALAVSSGRTVDNDSAVAITLAALSKACEIEDGRLEHTSVLNEDGSINAIDASCSVKVGQIRTIWGDGDFACAMTRADGSQQRRLAIPANSGTGTEMTENLGYGSLAQ